MKLFKKVFASLSIAFLGLIVLASCSSVTNSYSQKINDAAYNKEYVTVEDARKELGDECIDLTSKVILDGTGTLVGIKGLNKDNYLDKIKNGDPHVKYDVIMISVIDDKCIGSTFQEMSILELQAILKIN